MDLPNIDRLGIISFMGRPAIHAGCAIEPIPRTSIIQHLGKVNGRNFRKAEKAGVSGGGKIFCLVCGRKVGRKGSRELKNQTIYSYKYEAIDGELYRVFIREESKPSSWMKPALDRWERKRKRIAERFRMPRLDEGAYYYADRMGSRPQSYPGDHEDPWRQVGSSLADSFLTLCKNLESQIEEDFPNFEDEEGYGGSGSDF